MNYIINQLTNNYSGFEKSVISFNYVEKENNVSVSIKSGKNNI